MGIKWLSSVISNKIGVLNVSIMKNGLLEVEFEHHYFKKNLIYIYMPDNSEYVVTEEIVEKAKRLGANVVVCDTWCKPTNAAYLYGKDNSVKVFTAGVFLKILESGKLFEELR